MHFYWIAHHTIYKFASFRPLIYCYHVKNPVNCFVDSNERKLHLSRSLYSKGPLQRTFKMYVKSMYRDSCKEKVFVQSTSHLLISRYKKENTNFKTFFGLALWNSICRANSVTASKGYTEFWEIFCIYWRHNSSVPWF